MKPFEILTQGLLRPRQILQNRIREPSWRESALVMGIFAFLYSLFCLVLWWKGHYPSFMTLPIPAEDFYLWQALFVLPLFQILWLLFAWGAQALARLLGGGGRLVVTATVIAISYVIPLTFAFLLPDVIVYLFLGFDSLATLMRLSAPLVVFWILSLGTYGVSRAHGLSISRAMVAVGLSFLLQAMVAGFLIR